MHRDVPWQRYRASLTADVGAAIYVAHEHESALLFISKHYGLYYQTQPDNPADRTKCRGAVDEQPDASNLVHDGEQPLFEPGPQQGR